MVKSERMVTVLGIDPGTTRLGYALVEGPPSAPRLITSGVIGDARAAQDARLHLIFRELTKLFRDLKPDSVVLEKLFFAKNRKTALQVAEARGIILLTAKIANRRVYEYAPSEVKIAVTGNGAATKGDIARIMKLLVGHTPTKYDDESDAVAIAITGLVSNHSLRN